MMRRRLILPLRDGRLAGWPCVVAVALLLAAAISVAAPTDAHALGLLPQCADNLDNDGDGSFDFPFDPGCTGANPAAAAADNAESDDVPAPRCGDGADNDRDGRIDFPSDPGCRYAGDAAEADGNAMPTCSDAIDNDGDSLTDFPDDPDCNWARDSEVRTDCSDGLDNDGDGRIDFPSDLGCTTTAQLAQTGPNDASEVDPPACNDGRDNDADGTVDFDPFPGQTPDPGCGSASDPSETDPFPVVTAVQCEDRIDNDGDGRIDFPADPGCMSAGDVDEADPPPPLAAAPQQCSDGRDNDADGRIDFPSDPGCVSASDNDETNQRAVVIGPSAIRVLTPFPVVRVRGSADRRGTKITLLTVQAPRGSVVAVYCHGAGCPVRKLIRAVGARTLRVRKFERRLRGRATLRVYVTKPGFVGKYTRIRFRRGAAPLRLDRCADVSGGKARICPSA